MQISKFWVGDKVNLIKPDGSREGPFTIASVPSAGIYTLSFQNGQTAEGGDEIEENDLEAA